MRIVKRTILQNLIITLVLCYSIMPIVSRFISTTFSTYFYMALVLVLIILVVFVRRRISLNRAASLIFPFLVWQMLELLVSDKPLILGGYQALLILLPIFLGAYILEYRTNELSFFSRVIFLALIITIITTVVGLLENPEAARWLATVDSSENPLLITYNWKNMGGYEFVYSVVLLYPLVIFAYKRKKLNLVITIALTVGVWILAILAEYTTALLLVIITTVLFFVKRNLKQQDVIILVVLAVAFCVIFSGPVSDALIWLGDTLDSNVLTPRIHALAGGRTGLEQVETKRLDLYLRSLNTFLSNPLLGTFIQGGSGTGNHSFILDTLAKFGFLGAAMLFFMYKKVYQYFYQPMQNESGYGYILWVYVQSIFLSCINTGMWLYVLTLYAPIFIYVICKKGKTR